MEDVEELKIGLESEPAELSGSDCSCDRLPGCGCEPPLPPFFPDVINVLDALVDEVEKNRSGVRITITYSDCPIRRCPKHTVSLVIGPETVIRNEQGRRIRAEEITEGMTVHASFSQEMTRSIPPQAQAYLIQIVGRPVVTETTIARIAEVSVRGQYILTIRHHNPATAVRFQIAPETVILDVSGRPIPLARLRQGLRVRVEHASFMTASIPPQTTAYSIQVLRG